MCPKFTQHVTDGPELSDISETLYSLPEGEIGNGKQAPHHEDDILRLQWRSQKGGSDAPHPLFVSDCLCCCQLFLRIKKHFRTEISFPHGFSIKTEEKWVATGFGQ